MISVGCYDCNLKLLNYVFKFVILRDRLKERATYAIG